MSTKIGKKTAAIEGLKRFKTFETFKIKNKSIRREISIALILQE